MVIVGGYNVYPREVDEVLLAHPARSRRRRAPALLMRTGETVCAFVVAKEGATIDTNELIKHCKKSLAPYKVPSRIYLLDALPRTTVGKIDKLALRERLSVPVAGGIGGRKQKVQ
jgi:long-chain acyl-CoA synthetase